MTAITLSSIPSSINTYERLAVWALQCLQNISNGDTVVVIQGEGNIPKAQVQLATTADGVYRFILTAYIPVDAGALNSPTAKTWMAAEDISTSTPHINLLSN
jgi:hypothetical protein